MKIGVVDADINGLLFSLLCEKNGYEVIVTNKNEDYIFNLNNRICITDEPLAQSLLLGTSKFSATTDITTTIKESDIIFVFSNNPSNIDGNYDTTKIFDVVTNFYTLSSQDIPLHDKKLIICSTMNPGETEQIQTRLNMFNVQVAYCPFFTESNEVVKNIENLSMLLIGTDHQDLANELIHINSKLKKVPIDAYIMSSKSAEIVKLGINTFLSSKINQSNMIGQIVMKSGVESELGMVLSAIGGFDGIGKDYMSYGFGYGGPRINGDNKALKYYCESLNLDTEILTSITMFNNTHLEFLKNYYIQQNPNGEQPFVFNHITYKKGVNVLEESQQFKLCIKFLDEGYNVNVIESPQIISELNQLSEKYDGRLKFYKPGTLPSGILINLQ